jgi:NAD(P) transhydrogenase
VHRYDLAVIGTGPAGHYGAIQAAKLGYEVVAIEEQHQVGGVSALSGTIPSKALREATMHLTGLRQRTFYGVHYRVKDDLTIDDLVRSRDQIIRQKTAVFEAQLKRNGVHVLRGTARFSGPHELEVDGPDGTQVIGAERVLVAVGSRPAHPPGLPFDGTKILDSNQILTLGSIPESLLVVGAGVIGMEYASIFAALGVRTTVVNKSEKFLEFVDREMVETLKHHLQCRDVRFRLGEEVVDTEIRGGYVVVRTASNKELAADCLLYCVGRQGATDGLCLDQAGLESDRRGRISVNEHFQSAVAHIYAAGDVIGFPALAATSREQGRLAVCHAFGCPATPMTSVTPYGIYTIPEISVVGSSEEELTEAGVPYEVGMARYNEIARGQILGDQDGALKMIFDPHTRRILGVHIIGDGATELIHIGQAAKAFDATIDYFVDAVFNYPTLAECYKVAALDGINRLRTRPALEVLRPEGDGGVVGFAGSLPDPGLGSAEGGSKRKAA